MMLVVLPHDAPISQTRRAKIQQETDLEPSCLQIVDDLSDVLVVQRTNGLQLDQQLALDKQVGNKAAHRTTPVMNRQRLLPLEGDTFSFQLDAQRILVN